MTKFIYELQHFAVFRLGDDNTDNFGLWNKEHETVDLKTEAEMPAILLCDQHNLNKEDFLERTSTDNVTSIKGGD